MFVQLQLGLASLCVQGKGDVVVAASRGALGEAGAQQSPGLTPGRGIPHLFLGLPQSQRHTTCSSSCKQVY